MTDFEFTFALFGLLLGLSLAEVLAGLARAIEARLRLGSGLRIGWLTPLLGAFVFLDLLSFWQAAWVTRDVIAVSGTTLLTVSIFAGAYYLAASLVFPRAIAADADLDDHFFRIRRTVIGVMLALLVVQLAFYVGTAEIASRAMTPRAITMTAVLVALMIAAMLSRGQLWTRLAMIALVGRYIVAYLL